MHNVWLHISININININVDIDITASGSPRDEVEEGSSVVPTAPARLQQAETPRAPTARAK